MNRCLLTYEEVADDTDYSDTGLKKLSRQLHHLNPFPYTAEAQREQAVLRASKISIQGIQPKLSAILNLREATFEIADAGGKYILKPQTYLFKELPENEDLTMHLAEACGIEVPPHGLLICADASYTYFIKRMDRVGKHKLAMEDFAQLAGESRNTKYNYSMERLALLIDRYSTFPLLDKIKLFHRTLFNYLIGNEDMHLKNFSLITRDDKVELSPAYDLINSTIVLPNPKEEIALPIGGKKNKLTYAIFNTFARDRLHLSEKIIDDICHQLTTGMITWDRWIENSFLSDEMKEKYRTLLTARRKKISL